jgi:hypothetical protein
MMTQQLRTLYRPVGLREMERIFDSGFTAFPPRRPEQPIFYPVLNQPYAQQIAERWNTKDPNSRYAGFVTEFHIAADYLATFEEQVVGASMHRELWVPSEELEEFNSHIKPPIVVLDAYYGEKYEGSEPAPTIFKGKNAREQFIALAKRIEYSLFDVPFEMAANKKVVFLNYAYWVLNDFSAEGVSDALKNETLAKVKEIWQLAFSDLTLPGSQAVSCDFARNSEQQIAML